MILSLKVSCPCHPQKGNELLGLGVSLPTEEILKKDTQFNSVRMEDRQVQVDTEHLDDNLVSFVQALARVAVGRDIHRLAR